VAIKNSDDEDKFFYYIYDEFGDSLKIYVSNENVQALKKKKF